MDKMKIVEVKILSRASGYHEVVVYKLPISGGRSKAGGFEIVYASKDLALAEAYKARKYPQF